MNLQKPKTRKFDEADADEELGLGDFNSKFKNMGKTKAPTSMISQQSATESIQKLAEFKKSKDVYNLDDFEVKARLGAGAFGSVYLVKLKENPDLVFAMKVIDKQTIFSQNLVKYAKIERDVLALSTFNFIVKMYFAF